MSSGIWQGLRRLFGRLFGRGAAEWGAGLDQLPLAVVALDGEGRMLRLNAGWQSLTGYPVGECLHRNQLEFVHPDDRGRWLQGLAELGAAGSAPLVQILRYLTRGGELRWVEVRLSRQGAGVLACLADISEQMQHRQSLQARHRSLSNLLDGLPLMVYRCRNNRHWSMEYVSAGCRALTGHAPAQLIDSRSLTFNDLIHPDDREYVWAQVQAGLREQRAFHFCYRLLVADGTLKAVQERGCGIYSDAGELLGLEGVVLELAPPLAATATLRPLAGLG